MEEKLLNDLCRFGCKNKIVFQNDRFVSIEMEKDDKKYYVNYDRLLKSFITDADLKKIIKIKNKDIKAILKKNKLKACKYGCYLKGDSLRVVSMQKNSGEKYIIRIKINEKNVDI